MATADQISDIWTQAPAYGRIANSAQAVTYSQIAQAQAKAGDAAGARQTRTKAFAAAARSPVWRSTTIVRLPTPKPRREKRLAHARPWKTPKPA